MYKTEQVQNTSKTTKRCTREEIGVVWRSAVRGHGQNNCKSKLQSTRQTKSDVDKLMTTTTTVMTMFFDDDDVDVSRLDEVAVRQDNDDDDGDDDEATTQVAPSWSC